MPSHHLQRLDTPLIISTGDSSKLDMPPGKLKRLSKANVVLRVDYINWYYSMVNAVVYVSVILETYQNNFTGPTMWHVACT